MKLVHFETYRDQLIEIFSDYNGRNTIYKVKVNGKSLSLVNAKQNILLMQIKQDLDRLFENPELNSTIPLN